MPRLSDIQILTVAYNSSGIIGEMLDSVADDVPIVIVDNASSDSDALAEIANAHGAQVITNTENRGFGAACNIGAAVGDTPYLLFLNPDATLEPSCLDNLLEAVDRYPDASAFTPNVHDGRRRPAFRRRSRLLPKSRQWKGKPPKEDTQVPLMNGAAMFMKRAHFDAVGGFDETIFLYHEDDDLSLRLKAQFGPIWYLHYAAVFHAEGHSTARTPATAAFKARHMGQSAVYAMSKHGQSLAKPRVVASAFLQLLSPLTLLSARKRAKNVGFLRGAIAGQVATDDETFDAYQWRNDNEGEARSSLPPAWKIKRELLRLGRQIRNIPRHLFWFFFATKYYDWHLSKQSKSWSGDRPLCDKIAIVVIYPSDGVQPSHLRMLDHIHENGYATVVVSNLTLPDGARNSILPRCARYIERPNFGYDFGAYRDGVLSIRDRLADLDRLVLMNDSAWYPLPGNPSWLKRAEDMGHDLVGAVSNYGLPRSGHHNFKRITWDYVTTHTNFHYCSFALSFGPNILTARKFLEFWTKFRLDNDKSRVVRRGEIGMTQWVLDQGYTHDCTCNPGDLDKILDTLSDDRLLHVTQNTIFPEYPEGQATKARVLDAVKNDPDWRQLAIQYILMAASNQGTSYALPELTTHEMGFPFLKKSPLRLSKSGSDISLDIISRIPGEQGKEIMDEALVIRQHRTTKYDVKEKAGRHDKHT